MNNKQILALKAELDAAVDRHNHPDFIDKDPISIPHQFSLKQDIEIIGFWAAMLAWGNRQTIINKCQELLKYMDNAPYDFIRNHTKADLKPLTQFKHRTFNATDTLYFISFFQKHYQTYESLEEAFAAERHSTAETVEPALIHFHEYFFDDENSPNRTRKHIATPARKSACKRLNMFLRWMVRQDDKGVDFGIWQKIHPRQLVCPCDVHVERVARRFGLIKRKSLDWQTALELTQQLRILSPEDPVKYDFALFGLGLEEKLR